MESEALHVHIRYVSRILLTEYTNRNCKHEKHSSTKSTLISSQTSRFHEELIDYIFCVLEGPYKAPCEEILLYQFSDTFNSYSCDNFAVGEPFGLFGVLVGSLLGVYLAISVSLHPKVSVSLMSVSLYLCISMSLYLCIAVSLHLCISVSMYIYTCFVIICRSTWTGVRYVQYVQ